MSLLTPSESHAFQNFLSQMDQPEQMSSEWNMYQDYNNDGVHVPQTHGTEALAKATKELMSLDTDRWPDSQQQNQQLNYDYYPQHQHQYGRYEPQFIHPRPQHPRRNVTFPFLAKQARQPQLQIPTVHHSMNPDPISSSSSHSFISTPTTASSSSSFSFGPQILPSPTSPVRTSSSPGLAGTKRPLESATMSISKRSRPSPPFQASTTPTLTSSKPALLSPSQKKANHIQSEQKRRANIRRGYEALCDTVPALREAIRQEEEAMASTGTKDKGKSKKSRPRGKMDETGEKIDGRAGPRSENVVLMKTIEYINDLHSERSQLLQRLENARAVLPRGHPALFPPYSQPLWEREWKGGEHKEEAEASEEPEDDGE